MVTGYLQVEYLADGARVFNCTKHSCRSLPKTCKKLVSSLIFFAKSAGRCFAPVTEITPNTVSLRWNFYADIQLIRGRFWLQLWTLKKFSEPRVSQNDGAKEVGKWRKLDKFAERTWRTALCRLGVCRACIMCRNLLPARRVWRVFATATWLGGWLGVHVFNELFVTAHVDDIILNTDSNRQYSVTVIYNIHKYTLCPRKSNPLDNVRYKCQIWLYLDRITCTCFWIYLWKNYQISWEILFDSGVINLQITMTK